MSNPSPFTYQNILDRWADGLKTLGAANGAGLLASLASLQYLKAGNPHALGLAKCAVGIFLVGAALFAWAFLTLTLLPIAIEKFAMMSNQKHGSFLSMLHAFSRHPEFKSGYSQFLFTSLCSLACFVVGLMLAALVAYNI